MSSPAQKVSRCSSCEAEIIFLWTRKCRAIPVDAATVKLGDQLFDASKHITHFATCPNAAKHRTAR